MAVIALFGVLFALPMVAAGAQEGGPPPTPDCVIDNAATTTVTFPTNVTISGTLSLPAHLTLFSQAPPGTGTKVAIQEQDFAAGPWSFTVNNVTVPTSFSVGITFGNENAYTGACATAGGSPTVTVSAAEAAASQPAAAALAFTGSSDTPSFVLIGIAALVVGAVLVIAARRRSQVS